MLLAIVNGILTSIALETVILSRQMPLRSAFQTAVGMSLISMLAMEIAMNLVDVALTGGAVLNLWVLPVMFAAGFLAAVPYNYWRLKALGKSCH
jgi:energy-converting hydrogenase Eha subunit A|tara:strand:+ start:202 stop:483 length:282 start_codon:yes stop_codon:yes gene_type:complete